MNKFNLNGTYTPNKKYSNDSSSYFEGVKAGKTVIANKDKMLN